MGIYWVYYGGRCTHRMNRVSIAFELVASEDA